MEPISSPTTHNQSAGTAWTFALVAMATIASAVWLTQSWLKRDSLAALTLVATNLQTDPWSLETSSRVPAVFRISGTPHWQSTFGARLTSNTEIYSSDGPAILTHQQTSAKIVLGPQSSGRVTRNRFYWQTGFAKVTGPVSVAVENEVINIAVGDTLTIRPDQKVRAKIQRQGEQMLPSVGTIHDLSLSPVVVFSWPPVAQLTDAHPTEAQLELSRDHEFKNIVHSQSISRTNSTSSSANVDFSDRAPGTWYARVGEHRTVFNVVATKTPMNLGLSGKRWLRWTDEGIATRYRVEFYKTESFQATKEAPAQSVNVSWRELDLASISEGNYFARVVALNSVSSGEAGAEQPSRPLAVRVLDRETIIKAQNQMNQLNADFKLAAKGWRIHLKPNEMLRVRDGYVILRETELRGIGMASPLKESAAHELVFELSRDETFANAERVRPDSSGELLPPALPLGTLYARLRHLEADGSLGAFGPPSRLTTLLPAPEPVRSTANKSILKSNLSLTEPLRWALPIAVSGYRFELSLTADFANDTTRTIRTAQNFYKIQSQDLEGLLKPENPECFWRVTAVNDYGQPISLSSPPERIRLMQAAVHLATLKIPSKAQDQHALGDTPRPPELSLPVEDAVVVGGAAATRYGSLSWDDPDRSAGVTFEIQIATDGDFSNVIIKQKTKIPRFALKGDLPEGSLFWRVRKLDPRKPASAKAAPQNVDETWSKSRHFELVYE